MHTSKLSPTNENTAYFESLKKIKQRDVEVLLKQDYRGIWETAIKKYSDSAHFIYELLQNADDVKASWVEFTLERDGLWFKHNGTVRFTISDPESSNVANGELGHINAITSIGNSTKYDEQKIGKFGIGFKAVFAYSLTPHIYDDDYNFKLENYIVPKEIPADGQRRRSGETLFYFPFNHVSKSKEEAYSEIEEKLRTLVHPVLFLNHLQKIKWVSSEKNGEYLKNIISTEQFQHIEAFLAEVVCTENGVKKREYIWILSSEIIHDTLRSAHKISVGFFVLNKEQLETDRQYAAFCFFPTKVEKKLGFVIQAPFLLNDSREGIKAGEPWNVALIQLTAELAADAISILKVIGIREKTFLVNDRILDLIPYKENDFGEVGSISFKPFYDEIWKKFKGEQLLPGRKGKYFTTDKAYWASDPNLAELFSDRQISQLMENPNSGWVFVSKGQKQLNQANKHLESYINSIVTDSLDPKKLLRKITAEFIEDQPDTWLLKFYTYLVGHKSLWDDRDKLALKRPILLNQDRKAVMPFDHDTPNVFLPVERGTTYDTIYKPFVKNKAALEFFKGLGLHEPDLKAEIFKTIIPQYAGAFNYDNEKDILSHFASFLSFYEECPATVLQDYIAKLQKVRFVAARNHGVRVFCHPEQVYFGNEKLAAYFSNLPDIFLLDLDFYDHFSHDGKQEIFYKFLTALGLSAIPHIKEIKPVVTVEVKEQFALDTYEVSQTYYKDECIIDKTLEGLEDAMKRMDLALSVIIWDYLLMYMQGRTVSNAVTYLSGSFYFVPKWSQYGKTVKFDSTLFSILKNDKWLYNNSGVPVAVNELEKDDLHPQYNITDAFTGILMEALGIENPDADLHLTDEQQQAMNIGRKLLGEGITEDELAEFVNLLAARKRGGQPEQEVDEQEEVSEEERAIGETLAKIQKGIKEKRKAGNKPEEIKAKDPVEQETNADQDEYVKPGVDYQKEIEKLKEQMEVDIENFTQIAKLNEIANTSEKYSYAWFKALLELEYMNSSEGNTQGKPISIQFTKVEREPGTERTLILKHPNRYIPQSIEDIGDLQIRLYTDSGEAKSVTVEVVSVKEYTLRAKLKKSVDISEIDLDRITRIVIDIKNPVFILEELRKAFYKLDLADDFNLQRNLTENIRFIFGPPGTGKTTFLAAEEIIPFMQQKEDLKVLVLTPTNKAADVLTKRIIEKMGGDETYHQWLLRFGTTADAELEQSSLVVDKNFDIRRKPRNTTISTIARFSYDYFQPELHDERLHLKYLQWDYIIIDEASMVTLASIAYVLYQKPDAKFIIAGDPFQIQPITLVDQWKDMNIYEMVQLNKFVDPVTVPHQYEIVNLKKQYRSIPTIGNVFSHFTYNGILEHHRKLGDQKPLKIKGLDLKDINIIKFPVSKYESIYKPNTLNKSHYQIYAALFTVEFVQQLVLQIEQGSKDKFRIGIICPYKAQATLIEKVLAQQHLKIDQSEILIGTIHGFQGDECDIIITLFNPPFSISRSRNMFLNKQNILNVSISRARDYLFVIMPNDSTTDIDNLYKVKKIEQLIHKHAKGRCAVYESEVIEQVMFGSNSYIYDNSFATSHQSVNVYSKPEKKYEVRCEEVAVDVQIRH